MEGKYTRADILLTVDVARLIDAKKKNLFKAVESNILHENVPREYRDKDKKWFGLSLRSRVFVYVRL